MADRSDQPGEARFLTETSAIDTPSDLIDLVQYQDSAIVSRVLAKDSAGSVTAFAFDAGQALSEHMTPFDSLLYVFDGTALITISGSPHQLKRGQVLRLPAHAPHTVEATDRFKMLLVMLRPK
jgi:quercetin dioxygenase-like cupin family protein